ncbi:MULTISPECIES: hypothetical protein [Streptomyces]|uniref:Uncharacterized protein n=1 Tax=Streptomyces levis TaxID=285566 RepID=A0ABN3NZB1_9ACTN|nr:hypothetical protein [Streptomyces sp. XY006]OXS32982.1 hypothetical protein CHR28_23575 [Streptomyces sp. XY006]
MRLRTAELCECVLLFLVRLLLPAQGRHRAAGPVRREPAVPHSPPPPRRPEEPLLMDTPLVRPYLAALEVSA